MNIKDRVAVTVVVLLTLSLVYFSYSYFNDLTGLLQRVRVLEKQVEYLNEQEPEHTTEVVEVVKTEQPIYIKGETVEKTELPDGHWEEYCLYDKDVAGYPTTGVAIRDTQGDCEGDWRRIYLWEK